MSAEVSKKSIHTSSERGLQVIVSVGLRTSIDTAYKQTVT